MSRISSKKIRMPLARVPNLTSSTPMAPLTRVPAPLPTTAQPNRLCYTDAAGEVSQPRLLPHCWRECHKLKVCATKCRVRAINEKVVPRNTEGSEPRRSHQHNLTGYATRIPLAKAPNPASYCTGGGRATICFTP